MFHLGIKHLLGTVFDGWRRAQDVLAALGAERRRAMRLDHLADRLLDMRRKIERLRAYLRTLSRAQRIDADGGLRGSLRGFKEDLRGMRCELAGMAPLMLGPRLQRAFDRLNRIASETYAAADRLQWEVDDHERLDSHPP